MAVDEINAAGGILGKKIRVQVEDDGGKPSEARSAVEKLITQDNVLAVLGEVASSRSIAGASVCQSHRVPMLSPASTNPQVTTRGDYIFRICFTDDFQGEVMARFAREKLGLRRVAVFYDMKNDYSVGLKTFFEKTFEELGGQVVSEQSYSERDTDFKAQLTSIKARNPEAIFIPGYYTEAGLIARQARELGIKQPLMGGDGWDFPGLTKIAGKAVEGCYFSTHFSVDDLSEKVQRFVKDYRKRTGKDPDAMAALGYDAAKVMADAIRRAARLDPKAVRDALAQTRNFAGITGTITIDENRNARKRAVILQIVGSTRKLVGTISPT
jgi:branched-chain amino acid transport system substrate-binding protein